MVGQVAMKPSPKTDARNRARDAELLGQLVIGSLQGRGSGNLVSHCRNSGDWGLSARLRRYAATDAAGRPSSASRRETISHAVQSLGSLDAAVWAAASAAGTSPLSSSTRASWICGETAPGSRRAAARASASAWVGSPLNTAAWLARTVLTVASGTAMATRDAIATAIAPRRSAAGGRLGTTARAGASTAALRSRNAAGNAGTCQIQSPAAPTANAMSAPVNPAARTLAS